MNDAEVLEKLAELGLELPPPPRAIAVYVPVVIAGGSAYVAGQVATEGGEPLHPGRLGADVTTEHGVEAARRAALQVLSALREALGSFERLRRIVKVDVFVASAPEFVDQPAIANGASEVLAHALGDSGTHARTAVGVSSLPLGACVEVAVTAQVDE